MMHTSLCSCLRKTDSRMNLNFGLFSSFFLSFGSFACTLQGQHFQSYQCMNQVDPLAFIHVRRILVDLQWRSVSVIYENINGFPETIIPSNVKHQMYNLNDVDIDKALDCICFSQSTDLNIVLTVTKAKMKRTIEKIDQYDLRSNGTTDLRHRCKLLILLDDVSMVALVESYVHHCDHVAVVVTLKSSNRAFTSVDMYTLLIHSNGRSLKRVESRKTESLTDALFPNVKYKYNNRHLKVTTMVSKIYVSKTLNNGSVHFSGYIFDVWNIIARQLNLSYEVTEPEDRMWGSYERGQWTGMIGQLHRKEVDIAVADISMYHERSLFVDFVTPSIMVHKTDIIYKRQRTSGNNFFLLLGPLRVEVYVTFLGIYAAMVIVYGIIDYRLLKARNTKECSMNEFIYKLSLTAWHFYGMIFKQDLKTTTSNTFASKFLVSSWSLLVLLLTSMYAANLIAVLSDQSGMTKISSISELVGSDYTTGVTTVALPYIALKTSTRPDLMKLYAKMLEQSKTDASIFHNSSDFHLSRVYEGGHSHVVYYSYAKRLVEDDCTLALVGEPVTWAKEYISFALPKNSPLKVDIDKTMLQLQESGILERLWKKWTRKPSNYSKSCVTRQVSAITSREVAGGFLVVISALVLSSLVLIFEICLKYKIRQSTQ